MSTVDNPEPKAAPQGLWRCQTGGVTVVIGNIGMTGEMAVAEAGATSAIRLIAAQSHHSRTADGTRKIFPKAAESLLAPTPEEAAAIREKVPRRPITEPRRHPPSRKTASSCFTMLRARA